MGKDIWVRLGDRTGDVWKCGCVYRSLCVALWFNAWLSANRMGGRAHVTEEYVAEGTGGQCVFEVRASCTVVLCSWYSLGCLPCQPSGNRKQEKRKWESKPAKPMYVNGILQLQ